MIAILLTVSYLVACLVAWSVGYAFGALPWQRAWRVARLRLISWQLRRKHREIEKNLARAILVPRPGEPACRRCGARLMFSARLRAGGLCGPCSRAGEKGSRP